MDDDPGWPIGWRVLLGALAPAVAIRAQRDQHPLVAMRQVFISFTAAIVLIGVVVAVLGDMTDGEPATAMSVAIVAAIGVVGVAASRIVKRTLDCGSDDRLAESYRTRFFLRLACCEAIALLAFVIGIVMGPWWVYYAAVPFVAVGFALLAPTQRNLQADQRLLSGHGCHRSIMRAMTKP